MNTRIPPAERKGRRFCWVCSRQLYGSVYGRIVTRPDGSNVLVHADCEAEAKRAVAEGF